MKVKDLTMRKIFAGISICTIFMVAILITVFGKNTYSAVQYYCPDGTLNNGFCYLEDLEYDDIGEWKGEGWGCQQVVSTGKYTCSTPAVKGDSIAKPKCLSATYDGSSKTLVEGNPSYYTLSKNSYIEVGKYTITATLKEGFAWSDGSTSNWSSTCEIKSRTSINVSSSSYKANAGDKITISGSISEDNGNATTICKGNVVLDGKSVSDSVNISSDKYFSINYTVSNEDIGKTLKISFVPSSDSNCISRSTSVMVYPKTVEEKESPSLSLSKTSVSGKKVAVGSINVTASANGVCPGYVKISNATSGISTTFTEKRFDVTNANSGMFELNYKVNSSGGKETITLVYEPDNKEYCSSVSQTFIYNVTADKDDENNNDDSKDDESNDNDNSNNDVDNKGLIYSVSLSSTTLTVKGTSTLSFYANAVGTITVSIVDDSIAKLDNSVYKLKANETYSFKITGKKKGNTSVKINFEPDDTSKYDYVSETHDIKVIDSSNINYNPQTGSSIYIILLIGFIGIGYSVWYFRRFKSE